MITVAKKIVELEGIGGSHVLNARDHISVPVFVHLGDVTIVQFSFLMGKDNAPVRPPWHE